MLDAIRKNASSWGVKVIFGLIIIVFVFWGVGSFRSDPAVVAYVDEQPILIKDFSKAYQESLRLIRNQNPSVTEQDLEKGGFKRQVFGQLVNTMILENQAAKLGVTVSPAELRAAIGAIQAFQNEKKQFDPKRYEEILKANDLNPAEFENDYRKQLVLEKLVGFIGLPAFVEPDEAKSLFDYVNEQAVLSYVPFRAAEFVAGVSPTDEQIAAYYEANKDKFKTPFQIKMEYVDFSPRSLAKPDAVTEEEIAAYYQANEKKYDQPEMVEARHLLVMIPPGASEEDAKNAEGRAKALSAKLQNGEEFSSLMPKDPAAENLLAEDYAWLKRGSLPPEFKAFEDKAFSMQKGEISEPVKTTLGYHVIQVNDRKAPGKTPLEEVKDEIRTAVAEEKAADRLTKALDAVQEKVLGGMELAKAAQEEGLSAVTTEFFSQAAPPAELQMAEQSVDSLFKTAQGAVTDSPLTTQDGFLLAKVTETKPEGYASLDEVKSRIATILITEESMKRAREKAAETAKALASAADRDKVLEEYKDKIVTSEPFSRRGFIPGLGMVPPLAQAVFDSKERAWLPEPFAVSDGYVLAKPGERTPPPAQAWEANKTKIMDSLLQEKRREYFQAFLTDLKASAALKAANTDILGPEPGQGPAGETGQDK